MKEISWKDRLRYLFDNILSKGTVAMLCLLAVASAILILGISGFVYLTGIAPEAHGFTQVFWMSLLRTLDPGTMGGDTGSWPFLLSMLAVTLGGIGTVSILIGLITTGINEKISNMRKGRSRVIETGHIVILGWTEQLFSIIPELVSANRNQPKSCIVILADKDKVEMEDDIHVKIKDKGHTRIVCRTGNPMIIDDLKIVSIDTARAIMIVAPDMSDPDTAVIKTMLAIINNPNRSHEQYHIVAEIRNAKNKEIAKIVGGAETELVLVDDIVARIMAQTCCQSGLPAVYTELLNFRGDEIYFKNEPTLEGKTFSDALLAYEDSSVIGIYPKDGTPKINPPMDKRIGPEDHIIAISEDDVTIRLSGHTKWDVRTEAIQQFNQPTTPKSEHILIIGWNRRALLIINQLDYYLAPGSQILVVTKEAESEIRRQCHGVLRNLTCSFQSGDATDRQLLDSLKIETYNHVILLCYSDIMDVQKADALTIMTLLHLRDIADHCDNPFSIVSEMLDIRDRNLLDATRADDFIVSDNIISLLMAQVIENKHLNGVFADIFDQEGSEIYLKPAENYVNLDGKPVNMYTVIDAARQRSEVAIGYRFRAQIKDATKNHGVFVNPRKSEPVTFSNGDQVIVFAKK